MIKDLLDISKIEFDVEAEDWKDALRKAGRYLVEQDKITEQYVENAINACIEKGPYIVIMPGVAFGHARPDESVKQECLHMIRLKDAVEFGSEYNDPVRVVFMFASESSKGHLAVMRSIAKMLVEPENVELLISGTDENAVRELLASY